MLYTNEEPLVQRTCIKTANLQHDNYQSEKLETQTLPSHSLLSKANESSRSIPEKLKLQTLVCGHQVLSSLSDKSLVSICQKPNMRIQTVGYQPWSVDELRHDAAQIELCRRYRPLILHYTNRMGNREFREDVESYLWAIFIESIYSFDLNGAVPFPGFVKAGIMYGFTCGTGSVNDCVIAVKFTFQIAPPMMEKSPLAWISSHLARMWWIW